MDLTDVLQMLGRAGRPQFDTSGIARIFTQDAKKEFYKHFLHTGFPVESSLHKVLDNHLGAEISSGTVATKQDALDYLTWTFFFRRLHKNPSFYGLEISAEEHNTIAAQTMANDYMVELVETSLRELDESSCAIVEPTGEVEPTPLGKIMSYYYLSHKTIRHLVKHVKRDATFANVLSWISHATEYDELPVRHNEDLINAELSKALPIPADDFGLPLWDPHVKSFLLLQAHFSRIDLPISDYVGDLNSVLDQSIRIVQASIDVLTELGYLSSCVMMIGLLQAIKSARWPSEGPLSIFPEVNVEKEKKRLEHPNASPRTLVEATTSSPAALERAAKFAGVLPSSFKRFSEPVSRLPILKLDLGIVNALSLSLNLTRQNPAKMQQNGIRIFAPRYPKPQTEGFFVILSYSGTDEIIALKRIGWSDPNRSGAARGRGGRHAGGADSKLRTSAKISFPPEAQGKRVDVNVHSDSYPGMKWSIEGIEVPEAPQVDAYGKGKEKPSG
jgi:antiviral helicase SLH1